MGWLDSSLTTLTFGTSSTSGSQTTGLDFTNGTSITSIGANAFSGTKFETVDLTKLTNLTSVGPDAFSNIVGLKEVKLSQEQAKIVNPGVFSGVSGEDGAPTELKIEVSGLQANTLTFSSTAFGTSNVTLTPFSNLNRFSGVTEMDLSAAPISTLQGPVLFGNSSITKLVLPASATNWKLTEPTNYQTAPVGWLDGSSSANKLSQGIEFLNFHNTSSNTAASDFNSINWQLVANILNMFGRVEEDKNDTNLLPWKEGFTDGELSATSVLRGWADKAEEAQNGQGSTEITGSNQTFIQTRERRHLKIH